MSHNQNNMLHLRNLCAVFAAIMLCLCSCSPNTKKAFDGHETLYAPRYATGFSIVGGPESQSTLIITNTPWQGADSTNATQLLILRGDEDVPQGFNGSVLRGDARRIICMSSTHVAMLDALGAVDRVVGVSGIDYITNQHIQAGRDTIVDVGYENNIDYEKILDADPDIVLLYGLAGSNPMEHKLRELGIPFMYVAEYLEEDPLAKAEWLVALGDIVGRRDEAIKRFNVIPEKYNYLANRVVNVVDKPAVMINTPYADAWMMASTGSYVARLIADAGGRYVYTKNTSTRSMPIDIEQAYLLTNSADVWINTGSYNTLSDLTKTFPKFADTNPVHHRNVWNTGPDYWESGVVNPHLVLQDLIMIFHPGVLQDSTFTYYHQL